MDNPITYLLLFLLFGLFLLLIYQMKRSEAKFEELKKAQAENQSLTLMQQQIGQLSERVDKQLQNVAQQLQTTTSHVGDSMKEVKEDIGKVSQATKQVYELAKDISQLEELLKAPKFRGGLGEFLLADLLEQILPPSGYALQYRFKSGEVVDAVIKIGKNLVPVDSKFPLENFQKSIRSEDKKEQKVFRRNFIRDIRQHVDNIALKYILPAEKTYDFALMYIPAENVYYETIIKDESLGEEASIFSYALKKRVIPVSPNSFYAYLQVILLGLKGLQIEKSALKIFQSLSQLESDLKRFREVFETLGGHLSHAKGKFDEAEKRLDRFSGRLEAVEGVNPKELEGK